MMFGETRITAEFLDAMINNIKYLKDIAESLDGINKSLRIIAENTENSKSENNTWLEK